jgi:DNA-binding response OmpR family regulator
MTTVLVVDDDKDLLEMMSLVLTKYDLNISCISKGLKLFDSINAVNPDLVLMDIFLGDADGRELCHQLKVSAHNQLPVILYSAGQITPLSIKNSLADDFVTKPFNISILASKIKGLISKSAGNN